MRAAAIFEALSKWRNRRRHLAVRASADAQRLLTSNPRMAYYEAQRLAAQARFAGEADEFIHWSRVAAEVAKLSNNPMDIKVVQTIVAEEEERARRASTTTNRDDS